MYSVSYTSQIRFLKNKKGQCYWDKFWLWLLSCLNSVVGCGCQDFLAWPITQFLSDEGVFICAPRTTKFNHTEIKHTRNFYICDDFVKSG